MKTEAMIVRVPIRDLEIKPGRGMLHAERVDAGVTDAGVVIPEQAKGSDLPRFRILALGPDELNAHGKPIPSGLKVGDDVFIAPQRGDHFTLPIPGVTQCICSHRCAFATVKVKRPAVRA